MFYVHIYTEIVEIVKADVIKMAKVVLCLQSHIKKSFQQFRRSFSQLTS